MFLAASVIALLCLVSVSHSEPKSCEELVRTLDQVDRHQIEGRWIMQAGSLKDPKAQDALKTRDSIVIDFHNSTYTQGNHVGGKCEYHPHDVNLEGHIFTLQEKNFTFTGTLYHTSCPDCVVLTFDIESPNYNSTDLYLVSRRRQVTEAEMEEFNAQAKCMELPPPVMMDPTKEICPETTQTQTEEEAEVEKA